MRASIGRLPLSGVGDQTASVVEPLLRAPPFPWAAPASIARPAPDPAANDAAIRHDGVERVFAALRQARVGGAFWQGEDDPWTRVGQLAVVRADPTEDVAIVAWLSTIWL